MKDRREQIAAITCEGCAKGLEICSEGCFRDDWPHHYEGNMPDSFGAFRGRCTSKADEILALLESKGSAPGESSIADAIEQCAIEAGERSPEGVSSHTMLGDMWDERIRKLRAASPETSAPLSRNTCDYCHQDLGGMAFDGHYTIYCHKPTCEAAALASPTAAPKAPSDASAKVDPDNLTLDELMASRESAAASLSVGDEPRRAEAEGAPKTTLSHRAEMPTSPIPIEQIALALQFREECAKVVDSHNRPLLAAKIRNLPLPVAAETELRRVVEEAIQQALDFTSLSFGSKLERPTLESVMAALRGDK